MLKVWVVGSTPNRNKVINEVIEPLEIEVLNTDQLDITNTDDVISFGEINRPDIIINCAAITDVYKQSGIASSFGQCFIITKFA
ncbi:MAG: NAD-dependent epimerase/dehydratase family protein [Streptococcus sp.]